MKKISTKLLSFVFAFMIFFNMTTLIYATDINKLEAAISDTAEYMYKTVKSPQVGSIGGEWAVLGLARSGYKVPDEYYHNYYRTVEEYVKACDGVLHRKKYTEYSRLIVALTSIGMDLSNVSGYNLLTPLGDYDRTIWQGLNGPIWALIALDSGNYEMPKNPDAKMQATRDMYIQRILDCQLTDGGWSLFGGTASASAGDGVSDPDITGMALQALAKYQDRVEVKKASEEALLCMSKKQNNRAGFVSWGTENSESCVQMIAALCELGIPLDDERFVKSGKTMLDNLMTYYVEGNGFLHTADGSGSNQMASEQGFYGLIAAQRTMTGKSSLYRMSDAISIGEVDSSYVSYGLAGKHADINIPKITHFEKTFDDITGVNAHVNQPAIESLASREIINGKTDNLFEPNATMTRAEFATIIVKALGFDAKVNNAFSDIKDTDWYANFVGTANTYGIVSGKSNTNFDPNGIITREEAAVMIARAAKLCGMDTEYDTMASRDVLSQFIDYVKCSEWSMSSLAFCYNNEILDPSVMEINPKAAIKRCEIAQMIFNMLCSAKLL
nr:S-layer homology domain-containing protein [uncultured Aminipila sp.]